MQSTPALRKFTLSRWMQLVERAWGEGLVIERHPEIESLGLCISQTRLKRDGEIAVYTVNAYGCSCPARGDCKHRALYLYMHPSLIPLAVVADGESVALVEGEANGVS